MVEVEIMPMLIEASARARNTPAATPGCDFIPAPTRLTLPIASSTSTDLASMDSAISAAISRAAARVDFGTVNEMSVVPSVDVFWTIMSTLMSADAIGSNNRAAMPGKSGTPRMVSLASDVSWAIPLMTACSMVVSFTQVPGLSLNDERT